MYEKIMKLKKEKKWLFYLLIFPFFVIILIETYNKYLIKSSKNIIEEAEETEIELKEKQDKVEAVSEYHEKKAETIEKEIQNKKIDKDWHLK